VVVLPLHITLGALHLQTYAKYSNQSLLPVWFLCAALLQQVFPPSQQLNYLLSHLPSYLLMCLAIEAVRM
jgi:hypothetical protein